MKPLPPPTTMNKLEAAYAKRLSLLKKAGGIVDWRFEPMKLILVHGIPKARDEMSIKLDFLVVFLEHFEFHETKGFWREDARLKIKMAAELFPWFRFVAVTRKRGVWRFEYF